MNEAVRTLNEGEWIKQTLLAYINGGPDKIAECLEVGAGLDWVPAAVAEARKLRKQWEAGTAKAEERAAQSTPIRRPKTWSDEVTQPTNVKGPAAQQATERVPSRALVVAQEVLPAVSQDYTIAAMNEHHAIIDNVGGKTVIACWEPSPLDPSRLVVVFQNKESFLLRYSNRHVPLDIPGGRSVSAPIGQYWLSHRERRQYRGVTFSPAGPKILNECLNLWQGWGVEAKPGDWGLIRGHIEDVLASGNEVFADYILRWIAWTIQNPNKQAEVALVLIGAKGAGKGTLARCLQPIFGAHAFQVTSREEVIGKFNGHLQDCILFVADEAYWGGDKRCVGRLQGMITEPTLPIERKGIDVFQVRNYLHVVMLAEPGWVIPAGRYERRYAAFAVGTSKRGNKPYFQALHRQMETGGIEAMLYDLRRMELGDWHPREIPDAVLTSAALQKQQGHNLPPLEQWYVMLLHNGALPGALAGRPSTAFTRSLIDHAKTQVPRLRELSEVMLRNFLIDEESIGIACAKYRSSSANGWTFPPLVEAREAWCRRYGPVTWDTPDVADWKQKPSLKASQAPSGAPALQSILDRGR
jgi:hypothetical protein